MTLPLLHIDRTKKRLRERIAHRRTVGDHAKTGNEERCSDQEACRRGTHMPEV